jgi:hypothetical protein
MLAPHFGAIPDDMAKTQYSNTEISVTTKAIIDSLKFERRVKAVIVHFSITI